MRLGTPGLVVAALIVFLAGTVCGQEYVDEPDVEPSGKLDGLHEEGLKIRAAVRGTEVVFDARLWRPTGDGPYPVAILNHGGITDPYRRSRYRNEAGAWSPASSSGAAGRRSRSSAWATAERGAIPSSSVRSRVPAEP